jgi:hypothetical protein
VLFVQVALGLAGHRIGEVESAAIQSACQTCKSTAQE